MKENNNDNNKEQESNQQDQQDEESDKKQTTTLALNKKIKKAKWKPLQIIYKNIKLNHIFYLYGSVVVFTDYTPETMFNQTTLDLISRYKQTQQVLHNKRLNTVETTFYTHDPGMIDFSFLVNIFERKQDQLYYQFAQSLKDFKIFVDTINKGIAEKKKILRSLPKILDKLDEQYLQFEQWSDNIIEQNFTNEFYETSLFQVNYRKGFAELKKSVSSQNMISLYGNTIEEVLESEMCKLKNKTINYDRNQGQDVPLMIQLMTHSLKSSAYQLPFSSLKINIKTLEGFSIPATQETHFIKYAEHKKNDPNFIYFNDFDYIFVISVIKVEDIWLKRLLDLRQEVSSYVKPKISLTEQIQKIQYNDTINKLNEMNKINNNNSNVNNLSLQEELQKLNSMMNEQQQTQSLCSSIELEQSSQQQLSQQQQQNEDNLDQIELESSNTTTMSQQYFIPEIIDLIGNDCMETIVQNKDNQDEKKEKLAQCLDGYYQYRKQAIELSTLEYSCQAEYFIDKFYSDKKANNSLSDEDDKLCQFRQI